LAELIMKVLIADIQQWSTLFKQHLLALINI